MVFTAQGVELAVGTEDNLAVEAAEDVGTAEVAEAVGAEVGLLQTLESTSLPNGKIFWMSIRATSVSCGYNIKTGSGKIPPSHPPPDFLERKMTTVQLVTPGTICLRNAQNPEDFSLGGVVERGLDHK